MFMCVGAHMCLALAGEVGLVTCGLQWLLASFVDNGGKSQLYIRTVLLLGIKATK